MTKKPHEETHLANYVERRVLELKSTKSQANIAAQAVLAPVSMVLVPVRVVPV